MISLNSLTENSDKIPARCPVFGQCGGCLYQNIPYNQELTIKEELLKNIVKTELGLDLNIIEPICASPLEYNYRNRLDLKIVRAKSGEFFMGFSPLEKGWIVPVESCAIGRQEISDYLPELKKEAITKWPAKPKYKQANLVVRSGDGKKVRWGGIGRRSCQLMRDDYFWTDIDGKRIYYSLDTFFQANLSILPKLFDYLKNLNVWSEKSILFDLYGGVGLFSMGLYEKARQIYLIEENPSSIQVAYYNRDYNKLFNIDIVEGKVEDKLPPFLNEHKDDSLIGFIDPPRDGLSPAAAGQLSGSAFDHLLYLSCHPESLARDLKIFVQQGWKIEKIKPFDFFPKTKHIETLVVLRKE